MFPNGDKKEKIEKLCGELSNIESADRETQDIFKLFNNLICDLLKSEDKAIKTIQQVTPNYIDDVYRDSLLKLYIVKMLYLSVKYLYTSQAKKTLEFQEKIKEIEIEVQENGLEKNNMPCDFENSIGYILDSHLESNNVIYDEYINFDNSKDYRFKRRNYLMVLKGFSSSTPLFYSAMEKRFSNNPIKGGGLFIKWNGKGIAIDPGINFMENMHRNGLTVRDIQYIIITHDHIDHNGDLNIIDDLFHYFSNDKNSTLRKIKMYCDILTARKIKQRQAMKNFENFEIVECNPKKENTIKVDEYITVRLFSTKHMKVSEEDKRSGLISEDEIDKDNYSLTFSFGIKLLLKDFNNKNVNIGYTSDTAYLETFIDELNDCKYIIANFSETNKADYEQKQYKENHLGYYGCIKLIDEIDKTNNPFFIISEFWAGKSDIRIPVVKSLRISTKYKNIVPGDTGMMFMLDNEASTYICSYCHYECPINTLHIVKNKESYSQLNLICEDCFL